MLKSSILVLLVLSAFTVGMVIGRYRLFPFTLLADAKRAALQEREYHRPRALQFYEFKPEVRYVMVGDSLTEGGLWNEAFPGVSLANRGVGGDTTDRILKRLDTIYSTRPKTAFLMAGVNDIQRKATVDETFKNYVAIVEQLKGQNISVVVQSTLEVRGHDEMLASVRQLNERLKNYTQESGLTFLDLNAGMADEEGLKKQYTLDGIHLNGKGYAAWAALLAPQIR